MPYNGARDECITTSEIEEFLECVDVAQVCSIYTDPKPEAKCISYAKMCRKQLKLPLGDLTELRKCQLVSRLTPPPGGKHKIPVHQRYNDNLREAKISDIW